MYKRQELGFAITLDDAAAPFPMTLRLIPRVLNLGIGCRRGVTAEAIAGAVGEVLCAHRLSSKAVRQVCTIDLKKEEAGLLAFCRQWGLPLQMCIRDRRCPAVQGDALLLL